MYRDSRAVLFGAAFCVLATAHPAALSATGPSVVDPAAGTASATAALAVEPTSAGGARGEPDWDLGAVGCTYVQEEPGLITLLFDTTVILPDRDGEWEIPIRILFNGEIIEVDHRGKFKAALANLNECPPPSADGTCANDPVAPCGKTTRTYKGVDHDFRWTCMPRAEECYCQRLLFFPASWAKVASAPAGPGIFEFIIDPDDEVPELDETNNRCLLTYEPQNSSVHPAGGGDDTFRLLATGPNPFRGETSFFLALADEVDVRVDVFGIGGALVRTLAHGRLGEGGHEIVWDGGYADGTPAGSGVYFVRARAADGRTAIRRVLRLER